MRALVLLNQHAGTLAARRDDAEPATVRAAFAAVGIDAETILVSPQEIEAELRRAVNRRPGALFIGGGDGTVGLAAAAIAGTDIALGVLPLGTLNHFAKDLGVPADWRAAVPAFRRLQVREVDLGEVNGRVFINNCSLGLYAEAVRRRDALRRQAGMGKWRAMVLASCSAFRRLRRMRLRLETENGAAQLSTPLVVISNNRYTGCVLDKCIRARLDEGQLWLHTTRTHQHFALLQLVLQSLRRRLDEVDRLMTQPLRHATITTEHEVPVAIDGEAVPLRPPLRFGIRPRGLRVFAPLPSGA
jgi:diacylglycerol kinase family enzyme